MLVLSRKSEASVILTVQGVRIRVTVLEIRGDKVRLGFEAPEFVEIHREEIQAIVDNERKSTDG